MFQNLFFFFLVAIIESVLSKVQGKDFLGEIYWSICFFRLVDSQSHSRMWYRVGAVRNMTGGRKTQPQLSMKLKEVKGTLLPFLSVKVT